MNQRPSQDVIFAELLVGVKIGGVQTLLTYPGRLRVARLARERWAISGKAKDGHKLQRLKIRGYKKAMRHLYTMQKVIDEGDE